VRVNGLGDGVQAIAAGHEHACAITQAGAVQCWGNNGLGQLGTSTDSSVNASAVAVQGLSEGAVVLGLGSSQSCAGTADGRVYCWGLFQGTPTVVSGLSEGVISVSPGNQHVCAVTRSNALKCWGQDTFGQLGNGSNTGSLDVVGGESGYVSVSSGPQHTCALKTDGLVRCWGLNDQGQLGDGSSTNSEVPVLATQQGGAATGVSARGYASCVLRTNRSLQCWGWLDNYSPGG
jgi:alpha-tubulin suppressor-like RCC1 family protein